MQAQVNVPCSTSCLRQLCRACVPLPGFHISALTSQLWPFFRVLLSSSWSLSLAHTGAARAQNYNQAALGQWLLEHAGVSQILPQCRAARSCCLHYGPCKIRMMLPTVGLHLKAPQLGPSTHPESCTLLTPAHEFSPEHVLWDTGLRSVLGLFQGNTEEVRVFQLERAASASSEARKERLGGWRAATQAWAELGHLRTRAQSLAVKDLSSGVCSPAPRQCEVQEDESRTQR